MDVGEGTGVGMDVGEGTGVGVNVGEGTGVGVDANVGKGVGRGVTVEVGSGVDFETGVEVRLAAIVACISASILPSRSGVTVEVEAHAISTTSIVKSNPAYRTAMMRTINAKSA